MRLLALKPRLAGLRQQYKTNGSEVLVSYEEPEVTDAYMLAYYANYAWMSHRVLRPIVDQLPQAEQLNVALFGSGPLPELLGLATALTAVNNVPNRVKLRAHDRSGEWARAAKISESITRRFHPALNFEVQHIRLDFNMSIPSDVLATLRKAHIIVFQNCCNEMAASSIYLPNIEALRRNMAVGSFMVIADQAKHRITLERVRQIESAAENDSTFEVQATFSRVRYPLPFQSMPYDVQHDFFDGVFDPAMGFSDDKQYARTKLYFSSTVLKKAS
jgi:hypothetical protein